MISMIGDRRKRWREYNRSERGKARHRRYRQSAYGKARLREKYLERVRLLDEAKSQAGCCRCGETDSRSLSFIPRDGQEVKFAPSLMNISRGLDGWKEVIAACDVICRNCLARKRRGGESVKAKGIPKTPQPMPSYKSLTIVSSPYPTHPTCEACETEFKPLNKPKLRRRKRFCSDRCRLLSWAARELLKAYQEGRADGLYDIITEIGGKLGP